MKTNYAKPKQASDFQTYTLMFYIFTVSVLTFIFFLQCHINSLIKSIIYFTLYFSISFFVGLLIASINTNIIEKLCENTISKILMLLFFTALFIYLDYIQITSFLKAELKLHLYSTGMFFMIILFSLLSEMVILIIGGIFTHIKNLIKG